jgi:hypothetical protein
MPSKKTIEQRLAEAGYGHRRDDRTENDGKRTVYRLSTGEVVGRYEALESIIALKLVWNDTTPPEVSPR